MISLTKINLGRDLQKAFPVNLPVITQRATMAKSVLPFRELNKYFYISGLSKKFRISTFLGRSRDQNVLHSQRYRVNIRPAGYFFSKKLLTLPNLPFQIIFLFYSISFVRVFNCPKYFFFPKMVVVIYPKRRKISNLVIHTLKL